VAWATDKPFGDEASIFSVSMTAGHVWTVGDDALIAHRTF
jgi:hypothetical protein